jgi:threonine dehydrogenase-like Zn-dependent dehydrogenase
VVGASAALAATARGFDVLVVGRHEQRLAPLRALGPRTVDAHAGGVAVLGAWEPVAVIDTVQSDESFTSYVEVLPPRIGQVVFSGHATDGTQGWGSMTRLQQRELTASFVSGWTRERLEQTLRLMRIGRLPVDRLVGQVARGPEEILRTMRDVVAGRLRATATLLDWSARH